MDRIKSAWEIALEKTKNMEQTPEERQKEREERSRLVAKGIAAKFLSNFDLEEFKSDLDKQGKEKEMVGREVVYILFEALELGDYEKMEKILEGVSLVAEEAKVNEIKGRFYVLFDQYHDARRKKKREIESLGRDILEGMGISGDAIRSINPAINQKWAREMQAALWPYEKEFTLYKKELLPKNS